VAPPCEYLRDVCFNHKHATRYQINVVGCRSAQWRTRSHFCRATGRVQFRVEGNRSSQSIDQEYERGAKQSDDWQKSGYDGMTIVIVKCGDTKKRQSLHAISVPFAVPTSSASASTSSTSTATVAALAVPGRMNIYAQKSNTLTTTPVATAKLKTTKFEETRFGDSRNVPAGRACRSPRNEVRNITSFVF
jgi:hypothetical protein